jgi:hypothetical protein
MPADAFPFQIFKKLYMYIYKHKSLKYILFKKKGKKLNFHILKEQIRWTLMILICIIMAAEMSLPPNPHIKKLIVVLTLYACLKHNLPEKILSVYEKYYIKGKEIFKKYL